MNSLSKKLREFKLDLLVAEKERKTTANERIIREAKTKVKNSSLVNRYLASSYRDETYNTTRSTSDPNKQKRVGIRKKVFVNTPHKSPYTLTSKEAHTHCDTNTYKSGDFFYSFKDKNLVTSPDKHSPQRPNFNFESEHKSTSRFVNGNNQGNNAFFQNIAKTPKNSAPLVKEILFKSHDGKFVENDFIIASGGLNHSGVRITQSREENFLKRPSNASMDIPTPILIGREIKRYQISHEFQKNPSDDGSLIKSQTAKYIGPIRSSRSPKNVLSPPPLEYCEEIDDEVFELENARNRGGSFGQDTFVSDSVRIAPSTAGHGDTQSSVLKHFDSNMYSSANLANLMSSGSKKSKRRRTKGRENSWDNDKPLIIPEEIVIPRSKTSTMRVGPVCSYGVNSFNNITGKICQDRVAMYINLIDYKGKKINFGFFGLYTGWKGSLCANYLRDNFHKYLMRNKYFPGNIERAVEDSLQRCEKDYIEHRDSGFKGTMRYNQ
jgi:hypothetical protein